MTETVGGLMTSCADVDADVSTQAFDAETESGGGGLPDAAVGKGWLTLALASFTGRLVMSLGVTSLCGDGLLGEAGLTSGTLGVIIGAAFRQSAERRPEVSLMACGVPFAPPAWPNSPLTDDAAADDTELPAAGNACEEAAGAVGVSAVVDAELPAECTVVGTPGVAILLGVVERRAKAIVITELLTGCTGVGTPGVIILLGVCERRKGPA